MFFALAALLFSLCASARSLSDTESRCAYLAALGYQADASSEDLREILLPKEFDRILQDYNALQLSQGFDLRPFAGKSCLCCSYDLTGFPGRDGRVIATLYIRRGRVIAGDIHTAAADGFISPLLPER